MKITHFLNGIAVSVTVFLLQGCASTAQEVALGTSVGTTILARTPTNEIEQIYYLGSFDPREQLPPTIYRVRVHGQASAFSNVKFASGWVPAGVIDSLNSAVKLNKNNLTVDKTADSVSLDLHRRLMQFGPEGFREAPAEHRLVIVMGSDPSEYFQGIETALGQISEFDATEKNDELRKKLIIELVRLHDAELDITSLEKNIISSKDNLSK